MATAKTSTKATAKAPTKASTKTVARALAKTAVKATVKALRVVDLGMRSRPRVALGFSDDGARMYMGNGGGRVYVWQVK